MINRLAISLLLAFLLTTACCCSPHEDTTRRAESEATGIQGVSTEATPFPTGNSAVNLNFALINYTGTTIRGVYLSPSESPGWEENVLAGSGLEDGDTVNIRFSPEEQAIIWDLKVEGDDERYAEWKNINLRDVSTITLRLKLGDGTVVVAEVDRRDSSGR